MRISFDAVIDKRMEPVRPIIEGWRTAIERDANQHPRDPSYYYRERPNVSQLAAGAWLSGATALQEFGGTKGWGKNKSNGRYDLHMSLKNGRDVQLESKAVYMRVIPNRRLDISRVKDVLDDAVEDVRKCTGASARFGCAFFIPYFNKRDYPAYKDSTEELIGEQIVQYQAIKYAHLWAWCFPTVTRQQVYEKGKAYYPGIVLALRADKFWR